MASSMSDDLPRTLRREREARGLDRGNAASNFAFTPSPVSGPAATAAADSSRSERYLVDGNTVTDIRIPFIRLMMFCFKLVFAAIPALLLLGVILWFAGHLLMTYAPWLVKLQVLIRVP